MSATFPLIRISSLSVDQRLKLVTWTIGLFFLVGILVSFSLWTTRMDFPMAPVINGLEIGSTASYLILAAFIASLLGFAMTQRYGFLYATLILVVVLLLQDQMRWQPWVYVYFLMLFLIALWAKEKSTRPLFCCLQILVIGIYFWSGIHKLNSNFVETTFRSILTVFFRIENQLITKDIISLGYLIPVTEIIIALALSFPKFRNKGVWLGILSHLFILAYLSPLGINSNTVVYPWNVAMILLVILLFYEYGDPWPGLKAISVRLKLLGLTAILLVWIMPVFNFFGLWDTYLSFSLYSDKSRRYYIAIGESELPKIKSVFNSYFVKMDGLTGGQIIDVDQWCRGELNVPFNPERRIFRRVCSSFCELGIAEDKLLFLEFEQPIQNKKSISFNCKNITEIDI